MPTHSSPDGKTEIGSADEQTTFADSPWLPGLEMRPRMKEGLPSDELSISGIRAEAGRSVPLRFIVHLRVNLELSILQQLK